jgi:hypothetical protein
MVFISESVILSLPFLTPLSYSFMSLYSLFALQCTNSICKSKMCTVWHFLLKSLYTLYDH